MDRQHSWVHNHHILHAKAHLIVLDYNSLSTSYGMCDYIAPLGGELQQNQYFGNDLGEIWGCHKFPNATPQIVQLARYLAHIRVAQDFHTSTYVVQLSTTYQVRRTDFLRGATKDAE